jgi:hypothetical protein
VTFLELNKNMRIKKQPNSKPGFKVLFEDIVRGGEKPESPWNRYAAVKIAYTVVSPPISGRS